MKTELGVLLAMVGGVMVGNCMVPLIIYVAGVGRMYGLCSPSSRSFCFLGRSRS